MNKAGGILLALVLAVVAVLFLAKPSNSPTDGLKQGPDSAGKASSFRVALITPGDINDGGWNQNAFEALQKIEKQLGASTARNKSDNAADAMSNFRLYASNGTRVVIGHASEWFDPKLVEIAKAHSKTQFLVSGTEHAQDNICGVRFILEDASYVLGQIAAGMSKTGTLGCVGPVELPVIESTFYAFTEGAKSIKPDIKVLVAWTNDFNDVARAKEQSLILLGKGADFIFHNANNGAPGVFQAVQEARKQGSDVYAFGSNADQNEIARDVILASAVLDIPSAYLKIVKSIQDGTFKSEAQFVGMPEGQVWVSYNRALEAKIPVELRKRADDTVAKIKAREFQAPRRKLK